MIQPTILVVEDDPAVQELISIHARMRGFDVVAADSGARALSLAGRLLGGGIIDLHLPDRNGIDVASALRRAQPGLPLVFISGGADDVSRQAVSEKLPGVLILDKPVDWEELWGELESRGPGLAQRRA